LDILWETLFVSLHQIDIYPFLCFRFGTVEDKFGTALCKKLREIGWRVSHVAVVRNEVSDV
jgi:hypothetical protein